MAIVIALKFNDNAFRREAAKHGGIVLAVFNVTVNTDYPNGGELVDFAVGFGGASFRRVLHVICAPITQILQAAANDLAAIPVYEPAAGVPGDTNGVIRFFTSNGVAPALLAELPTGAYPAGMTNANSEFAMTVIGIPRTDQGIY